MRYAIKNGELIKENEAVVPITDQAIISNYSVYEALRVLGGKVVHLSDHIKRLEHSGETIGLHIPSINWQSEIDKLIAKDNIGDATMRIVVYGTKEPLYFITWHEILTYPDSYYEEGVATTLYYGERFLPTCKTSNLLVNYLARKSAEENGAFEALLVDRNNSILEGSRSNFYAFRNGKVYTAGDDLVLDGVTRMSVIRALKEDGVDIVFTPIKDKDIYSCDALFISATSMGAMPINSVNGKSVKTDFEFVKRICKKVREWEL